MTFSKSTLIGLTLLGLASSGAYAQMTQQQPGQQTQQQPAQPTPPAAPNSTPSQRLTPAPATSPAPSAAPGATGAKPSLQTLDKDRDGTVSMTEAAADPALAKKFAQLDRNHDGKLDRGELAKYTP